MKRRRVKNLCFVMPTGSCYLGEHVMSDEIKRTDAEWRALLAHAV